MHEKMIQQGVSVSRAVLCKGEKKIGERNNPNNRKKKFNPQRFTFIDVTINC